MKASEAPDKIYLHQTAKGEVGASWLTLQLTDKDVEYTRTDAFIEKACEWLKSCLDNGMWIANDVGDREKEAVMEHFKKYMKGE